MVDPGIEPGHGDNALRHRLATPRCDTALRHRVDERARSIMQLNRRSFTLATLGAGTLGARGRLGRGGAPCPTNELIERAGLRKGDRNFITSGTSPLKVTVLGTSLGGIIGLA
jgi:hypothetical protein